MGTAIVAAVQEAPEFLGRDAGGIPAASGVDPAGTRSCRG
jgi:hypothetical protein